MGGHRIRWQFKRTTTKPLSFYLANSGSDLGSASYELRGPGQTTGKRLLRFDVSTCEMEVILRVSELT